MKYEITKGSEKDFEQAPEWATKVLRDNNDSKKSFVGELGGITLVAEAVSSHSWWKYNDGYVGSLIAERRPITEPVVNQQLTTEWDGEGLPPAGSTFDMRLKPNGIWLETKLIAAGQEQIIYFREGMEFSGHKNNYEFRPIRSPEDVVRDEAIESMRDVGYTLPAAIRFTKEEMAALYDAGYRKME